MFLFRKKPKSLLGLDIGASAVKIVELEKEEERFKLKNYAIFSLRNYLIEQGREIDVKDYEFSSQQMARVISQLISEAQISARDVNLAIPVYYSFYTLIDFPAIPEKEIANAVAYEARKYVPVPIPEVVLDWTLVSPPDKDGLKKQVLLIAVLKKIINDYSQTIRLSSLKLRSLEGETFSLVRALVGNDKSAIILIDIGARSVNISLVDNGYIRLTHNLEMGGDRVTQAIIQQMGFDSNEAEQLKKTLSGSQPFDQRKVQLERIVRSSLESVVMEIRKIINSYQTRYNRKIEKCILAGGGSRLYGLVDYLAKGLVLDVSVGDPFARIVCPDALKPVLKELAPDLAVALGLAMKE